MTAGDWIVVGALMAIPSAVLAALAACVAAEIIVDFARLAAVVFSPLARLVFRPSKHERSLANIARLERELGIREAS